MNENGNLGAFEEREKQKDLEFVLVVEVKYQEWFRVTKEYFKKCFTFIKRERIYKFNGDPDDPDSDHFYQCRMFSNVKSWWKPGLCDFKVKACFHFRF
jgi:hypothetical protein